MPAQRKNDNIKRRGRPATGKGELIGVRLHPPLIVWLDDWIEKHAAQTGEALTRPEAIRRLLEDALTKES